MVAIGSSKGPARNAGLSCPVRQSFPPRKHMGCITPQCRFPVMGHQRLRRTLTIMPDCPEIQTCGA